MTSNKDDLLMLWLTDIHYYPIDGSKKSSAELRRDVIDAFLETVRDILREKNRLDYVIISGDIAFSGTKPCYDLFWKEIIIPLHETIKEFPDVGMPKILTIPGNHDLEWRKAPFIKDYLSKRTGEQKNEFLEAEEKKFIELFSSYTNRFGNTKANRKDAVWKDFFDLPVPPGAHAVPVGDNPYPQTRLFGYFLDTRHDVLFILLNTAWYSLGAKFNEIIGHHYLEQTKYSTSVGELVRQVLNEKDTVVEYNGQIYGNSFLGDIGLGKFLDKFPGLMVITCMHHPRNWMAWYELYNANKNALISQTLIERSDIVLTGHEHVPDNVKPEYIEEAIHFKGGMFMDKIDYPSISEFEHNRFSLLEITDRYNNPAVTEHRYLYDSIKKKWQVHADAPLPLDRSSRRKHRVVKWADLVKKLSSFHLKEYVLKTSMLSPSAAVAEGKLTIGTTPGLICNYLYCKQAEMPIIYLFPITAPENFYELLTRHPATIPDALSLDPAIASIPAACSFLVPDALVDTSLYNAYDGNNSNDILGDISKYADILFDRFRHAYFGKLQEDPRFPRISKSRFMNTVIPYWLIEKYTW